MLLVAKFMTPELRYVTVRASPSAANTAPLASPSSRKSACSVTTRSPDRHRQGGPPPHRGRVGLLGAVPVDLPGREPAQDLFERDPPLQPGQRGAEAEVDAVPEGDVVVDLPVDVEPVGL